MQKCWPRDHLRTVATEGKEARARGVRRRNAHGVRSPEKKASAVWPEKKASAAWPEKKLSAVYGEEGARGRRKKRWGRSSATVAAAALLGSAGDEGEATTGRSGAWRRKLGQRRSEKEDCALKYTRGPLVPVRVTNWD